MAAVGQATRVRAVLRKITREFINKNELILFPEAVEQNIDEFISILRAIYGGDAALLKNIERDKAKYEAVFVELMVNQSELQQGRLNSIGFWKCKQRLEEGITKIYKDKESKKSNPLNFKHLFGLEHEEYGHQYNIAPELYLDLGMCGGAFAVADKQNNKLLLMHNSDLQPELSANAPDLPFIDLSYRYNYRQPNRNEEAKDLRELLDLMYISVRNSQTLTGGQVNYSPEFVHYFSHRLEKGQREKLLPFERSLTKDGFKFLYCTVGEVLFHLYAWRLLVRKIQHHDGQGLDFIVSADVFGSLDKFNLKGERGFWERISELQEESPEKDWLHDIENAELRTPNTLFSDKLKRQWKKYKGLLDDRSELSDYDKQHYKMSNEYEELGLFDKNNVLTREFLGLIQYCIHTSRYYFKEEARTDANTEQGKIVHALYTIQGMVSAYYQEKAYHSTQTHDITFEQINRTLKERNLPSIDICIRRVVKEYLMEGESKLAAKNMLMRLHQKCRFPILPYYYELAVGEEHQAREHLAFCLWDDHDSPIELEHGTEGTTKETGVMFVILTVKPIWCVQEHFHFTSDNKSIHVASQLSEKAFTRLFRLYDIMNFLMRPILDEFYYRSLIRSVQEQQYLQSLSHELGKITDYVFYYAQAPFRKILGEQSEAIAAQISAHLSTEKHELSTSSILENWSIIPHTAQFNGWSYAFMMWTGRVLNLLRSKEIETLGQAIEETSKLSKQMHTAYKVGNEMRPRHARHIKIYEEDFTKVHNKLYDIQHNLNEEVLSLKFQKIVYGESAKQDELNKKRIEAQNAFVRLLVASITNIHEHSKGDFNLKIDFNPSFGKLKFYFENPIHERSLNTAKKDKMVGTEYVLKQSLKVLKGDLLHFDKSSIQINTWITEYKIPIAYIFN